jgi:BlaI family transcriptional regulator, penicillinase repressor
MANVPSDTEFGILMVVRRSVPSTVREVQEALAKGTGYTGTLEQIADCARRGLLQRSERYRSHVCVHRVFEGSARNLVLGALTAQRVFDAFEEGR